MSNSRTRAVKRDDAKPPEPNAESSKIPAIPDIDRLVPSKPGAPATKPPIEHGPPTRFTYLLAAWTAERRSDGWYVASRQSGGASWSGPFADMENAILSIARGLCSELADRHTRHIEQFKLTPKDGRYGLKTTTRLRPHKKTNGSVV